MLLHAILVFFVLNTVTDIKETATAVNHTLMKLVSLQVEEGNAVKLRTTGDYRRLINGGSVFIFLG